MAELAEIAAHSRSPVPSAPGTAARAVARAPRRLSSCSLIKDKARVLFRHFPRAFGGDEEAVHQVRVESRRLRVALALVAENPDGKRAKRARRLLRQLTRTAGTSRDLDVLFELYEQRLKALPARSPEQACLRKRLADARRRGRLRMVDALLDLEISQLRSDLRDLFARSDSRISVIDERIKALAEREGRALTDGLAAVGARLDPVALHDLRRRARRLRYAVEVGETLVEEKTGATKPWKMLQDLIGSIHDHHMLAEWLASQAAADRKRGNEAMAKVAQDEASWACLTMASLHDQFIAARPGMVVARGLSLIQRQPRTDLQ